MALAEMALTVDIAVSVAPRHVYQTQVRLAVGSTVRDALLASDVFTRVEGLSPDAISSGQWVMAVWGRKERLSHALRDRDRIELLRPLLVDPKEARRLRYQDHLAKWPKGSQRIRDRKKAPKTGA